MASKKGLDPDSIKLEAIAKLLCEFLDVRYVALDWEPKADQRTAKQRKADLRLADKLKRCVKAKFAPWDIVSMLLRLGVLSSTDEREKNAAPPVRNHPERASEIVSGAERKLRFPVRTRKLKDFLE